MYAKPVASLRAWRTRSCSMPACCTRRRYATRCCASRTPSSTTCWSARILDEAERSLIADGRVSIEGAHRLRSKMAEAFDGACVGAAAIAGLESAMTNDPKDRHVLAAAVASQAQAVITMNLKDFPEAASAPYGIEILHPDEFLMVLYGLDAELAVDIITSQAGALRNPPLTVEALLDKLAVTVPIFAQAIGGGSRVA